MLMLKNFIPEIFLSFSILLQLVINNRTIGIRKLNFAIVMKEAWIQTLVILVCLSVLYYNSYTEETILYQTFINDSSTLLVKSLIIIVSFALTIMLRNALHLQNINSPEYYSIFLLSLLALLIMVSVEGLVAFYLAMEMQALCFYILASFNRKSIFSTEAGLKYFISGSFISGLFLLGTSIIYGALGTLELSSINMLLVFGKHEYSSFFNGLLIFAFLLIVVALLFKLACAPFHFWSPDVYDGAPISSTLVFSVLPKIAILFFGVKFLVCIDHFQSYFANLLTYLGLISAIVGTIGALHQNRVKRVLIYSSIAQTGYFVVLLSSLNVENIAALFFFLVVYIITSLYIWGVLISLSASGKVVNKFYLLENKAIYLSDLKNFHYISPVLAFTLLVSLFSIAGIPPFAGFLSKMLVLMQLLASKHTEIAIGLTIVAAIGAYYYIRLIKILYFESKEQKDTKAIQVTVQDQYFDTQYVSLTFLLMQLVYIFTFPTAILAYCYLVACSMHLL